MNGSMLESRIGSFLLRAPWSCLLGPGLCVCLLLSGCKSTDDQAFDASMQQLQDDSAQDGLTDSETPPLEVTLPESEDAAELLTQEPAPVPTEEPAASYAVATDGSAMDGTATDGTATDGTATDGTATDGTATDGTATQDPASTAWASDGWSHVPADESLPPDAARRGFQHAALDPLLAQHPQPEQAALQALASENATCRLNGAIWSARCQDDCGLQFLKEAVLDRGRPRVVRQAAAEALAGLSADVAVPELQSMLDQSRNTALFPPELQAELLRGLSRHVNPELDPRFTEAKDSTSPIVRAAAAAAFASKTAAKIPDEFLDLRHDPDSRVRQAMAWAIAIRRPSGAESMLEKATQDPKMEVRQAALNALGILGGSKARRLLVNTLERGSTQAKMAAARGAARLKDEVSLRLAAADKAFQVRVAAAKGLADLGVEKGAQVAAMLLTDDNLQVSLAALAVVQGWPAIVAVPLILESTRTQPAVAVRSQMLAQLAVLWPEQADAFRALSARYDDALVIALGDRWNSEQGASGLAQNPASGSFDAAAPIGSDSPSADFNQQAWAVAEQVLYTQAGPSSDAATQVIAWLKTNPQAMDLLEQEWAKSGKLPVPEAYSRILAEGVPLMAAVELISSDDVQTRRRAASQVFAMAEKGPLSQLAILRLAELMVVETDPSVWQLVLRATLASDSSAASELAFMAAAQTGAIVRKQACEYFERHPNPRHLRVLEALVADSDSSVPRAAARAIAAQRGEEWDRLMLGLLQNQDPEVSMEAALGLLRSRHNAGYAALARMAAGPDIRLRRQVAQRLRDSTAPSAWPILERLLTDSDRSVRAMTMETLTQLTGDTPHTENAEPLVEERAMLTFWRKYIAARSVVPAAAETQGAETQGAQSP